MELDLQVAKSFQFSNHLQSQILLGQPWVGPRSATSPTLWSKLSNRRCLLQRCCCCCSLICLELWLELWWNCGTGQEFQLGLKEAFSELNEYLGIYAQLNHQVLCFFSIIFPKIYFLYFFWVSTRSKFQSTELQNCRDPWSRKKPNERYFPFFRPCGCWRRDRTDVAMLRWPGNHLEPPGTTWNHLEPPGTSWEPPGNHLKTANHLGTTQLGATWGTTWGTTWEPPGNLGTTWEPAGNHLGTSWEPPKNREPPGNHPAGSHLGNHLGTTWEPPGNHLGTTCEPLGNHLGTRWEPPRPPGNLAHLLDQLGRTTTSRWWRVKKGRQSCLAVLGRLSRQICGDQNLSKFEWWLEYLVEYLYSSSTSFCSFDFWWLLFLTLRCASFVWL